MVAHACNLSTQKREGDFQMFEASLHCTVRLSWCDFCCTDKQHNQKKNQRRQGCIHLKIYVHHWRNAKLKQKPGRSPARCLLALHSSACLLIQLRTSCRRWHGTVSESSTQVISQEKAPQNCLWASDEGSSSAKIPSSQMTLAGVE